MKPNWEGKLNVPDRSDEENSIVDFSEAFDFIFSPSQTFSSVISESNSNDLNGRTMRRTTNSSMHMLNADDHNNLNDNWEIRTISELVSDQSRPETPETVGQILKKELNEQQNFSRRNSFVQNGVTDMVNMMGARKSSIWEEESICDKSLFQVINSLIK